MKGIIVKNEYIKHEKEADILRMGGGSWTVNLEWINPEIKTITYITEKNKYQISFEDAIRHGFERHFQGEKKLVIPLKHWFVNGQKLPERVYARPVEPVVVEKPAPLVFGIGQTPNVFVLCPECKSGMFKYSSNKVEVIQCVKCGKII